MTEDNESGTDKKREIVDADDLISAMGVGHTVDFQKISPLAPNERLTDNVAEEAPSAPEPNASQGATPQANPIPSAMPVVPGLPVVPGITRAVSDTPAETPDATQAPLEPRKPQQTSQKLAGLIEKGPLETRKVPKTMIDPSASKNKDKAQLQEISPASPIKLSKSKVARTKLFKDAPGSSKVKRARRGSQEFVAKTLLDHSVIIETQSRFGERQKERLEQEISKRAMEPAKIYEPIKPQKKASPSCPFSWTEEKSKERFKYCSTCQANIYNFDGLEPEEAEALVFKRENREKFVLYGRADGKFMTSDCPTVKKNLYKTITLVSVSLAAIACIIALLILMPKPPAHDPTQDAQQSAPSNTVSDDSDDDVDDDDESQSDSTPQSDSSSSSGTNDGAEYHYKSGDPIPSEPPKEEPKSEDYSEPEQSGDFWQFDK